MPSTATDRLNGLTTSVAVKAPCRAATTANITLSGEQTIDGVAVVSGDRVLVKNQTSAVDNGIYKASATAWTRAADFDGSLDTVGGTQIHVISGTGNANTYWKVDGSSTALVVGTDAITFIVGGQSDSAAVSFDPGLSDDAASTIQAKLRERRSLLDFIPPNLHASIADRSNTTSLSTYIQNALNNVPAGAELYAPSGTYRMAAAVSATRSITLTGDPARETFDNSWDTGAGGTVFDYRGTTGDAFTFAAPNAVNSRVNVVLRDFIVRGARVSASGTTGNCITINGRTQAGTAVRLLVDNVQCCEAAEHGLSLTNAVYGGSVANFFAHQCGKNGLRGTSSADPVGEMLFSRIRLFSNGDTGAGAAETAGLYWSGGSVVFDQLSSTENTGPGAVLGGGPIVINGLQLESNAGTSQLLLGENGNGIQSVVIHGLNTAPGTGYTGTHVYITQYAVRVAIHGGYLSDTLGAGGEHIYREAGTTELIYDGLGSQATFTVVDVSAAYGTHQIVQVFARDSAGLTDATGDATAVTWKPDTEIIDNMGAYAVSTGTFTAPVTGLYDFEVAIPLSQLGAAHDRCTVFFTATSYSRTYRAGNVGAMRSANNEYTVEVRARIPMKQGETCVVSFDVTGGTKTVDTIGGSTFGFLSIVTAH